MKKYKDYQPTCFDPIGAFIQDERREWFVFPCSQTRDSNNFDKSNFNAALRELGGESATVEVHRFGHWGPGWFEIILINPDSPQIEIAHRLITDLENYPLLDEDDYYERQYQLACDTWEHMSIKERVEACKRFDIPFYEARHDYLPRSDDGSLFDYLTQD